MPLIGVITSDRTLNINRYIISGVDIICNDHDAPVTVKFATEIAHLVKTTKKHRKAHNSWLNHGK